MKKVLNLALVSALGLSTVLALTSCGSVSASRKSLDFKEYINVIDEDQFEDELEKVLDNINVSKKSFIYERYEYNTYDETFNNNISTYLNYEYELFKLDFENDIYSENAEEVYESNSLDGESKSESKIKTQTQKEEDTYYEYDLNSKSYSTKSYDSIPDNFFKNFGGTYYGDIDFNFFDEDKYYKDGDVFTITYKIKDSKSTKDVYSDLNAKVQFYKDGDSFYGAYSLSYRYTENYDSATCVTNYFSEGFEKLELSDVTLKKLSKDDYKLLNISFSNSRY